MTYFSQMAGLAVQNFVSAAVGMAVLAAVIRGFARRGADDARQLLAGPDAHAALHPAAALVRRRAGPRLAGRDPDPEPATSRSRRSQGGDQTLALGPAASQIAIKQLGTNGGGFFNVNCAMPFENPTQFSNFVELLFILLIPAALTATFGRMVGNRRQGWALYAAMAGRCSWPAIAVAYAAEQHGSPAQQARRASSARRRHHRRQPRGQGAALRHRQLARCGRPPRPTPRTARSTPRTTPTPASAACVPLVNMMTGEVIFGGVGSGLYGMLLYRPAGGLHRRA